MNLTDPDSLRRFLARHGASPRKELGQHFLCSPSVVASIVEATGSAISVLEIGPGPGVITSAILAKGLEVTALEVDPNMLRALKDSAPTATVKLVDALQADLDEILQTMPSPRAVVSNLPYYITAPLINRIARACAYWDCAVLMMQREVAEKLVASAGDGRRGSISVDLQSRFSIEWVIDVPPGAFLPPPKVTSAVLRMVPRLDPVDIPNHLLQAGFSQPRKTLANNLVSALSASRSAVEEALEGNALPIGIRAHQVSEEQWRKLAQAICP